MLNSFHTYHPHLHLHHAPKNLCIHSTYFTTLIERHKYLSSLFQLAIDYPLLMLSHIYRIYLTSTFPLIPISSTRFSTLLFFNDNPASSSSIYDDGSPHPSANRGTSGIDVWPIYINLPWCCIHLRLLITTTDTSACSSSSSGSRASKARYPVTNINAGCYITQASIRCLSCKPTPSDILHNVIENEKSMTSSQHE